MNDLTDLPASADATAGERELLAALDLPEEGVTLLLRHIESFCEQHGGPRRYASLLALARKYRAVQTP